MLILVIGVVLGSGLFAQNKIKIFQEGEEIEMNISDKDIPSPEEIEKLVQIKMNRESFDEQTASDKAYFGIYVDDVTFPKAQSLGYKDNFGVLISGVVENSPAWTYRLQEDDILVQMSGKNVMNKKEFDKIRATLRAGDALPLRLFRSGEYVNIDFVVGSRTGTVTVPGDKPTSKLSPGYGGGSWIPVYFKPDMTDVNQLLKQYNFEEQPEDGFIMHGGGGKLPVGKGFFIGGYGVVYEDTQRGEAIIPASFEMPEINYGTKWLRYTNAMGGVTLDKRIPITKNLITSLGFMLGGAGHSIEITRTKNDFTWGEMDITTDFNNFRLTRSYAVIQPRAEIMFRLLSWLALRAEGGYTYGYNPGNGWRISGTNEESINVKESPKTEYKGYNISIGPWFGF